jgi:type IV pilus assembly protein PilW
MTRPTQNTRRSAGFSLIELLVSMAIGLVVTLAIAGVMIRSEGSRRSSTSVNDINQTGAYVAYLLDRSIRNAGSGYSQSWGTTFGCLLNASVSNTNVLPIATAFPATSAFASFALPVRLAPVIIGKDLANSGGITGGDLLMVMGGTGGAAEVPMPVNPGSVSSSQLQVQTNIGFQPSNIVLVADTGVPGGCMLQQVDPAVVVPSSVVPLSGTYYKSTGSTVSLTSFGANTLVAQMGVDAVNPPQFQLFGVGANNTLWSYDLLQLPGDAEQPIADGVVEMHALYGLTGTPPTNVMVPPWVDPVVGSGFAASELTNGTAVSQANLRRIVAIRLGFFLRTSLKERAPDPTASSAMNPETYAQAVGTSLTLFSDLGSALQKTRALSGSDLNYRWRTVEVTIPLINVQDAPQTP